MKKLLLITLILLSLNAHADGVDDESFYNEHSSSYYKKGGVWVQKPNAKPHDVNYWRDFDKHPCSYDLGFKERSCDESLGKRKQFNPHDIDHGNGNGYNTKTIPEPETLMMLSVGILALALHRKIKQ